VAASFASASPFHVGGVGLLDRQRPLPEKPHVACTVPTLAKGGHLIGMAAGA
jgi:hypothetical protein